MKNPQCQSTDLNLTSDVHKVKYRTDTTNEVKNQLKLSVIYN